MLNPENEKGDSIGDRSYGLQKGLDVSRWLVPFSTCFHNMPGRKILYKGLAVEIATLRTLKNERQHYLQELKARRHLLCQTLFSIIPQVKIHAKYNIGGSRLCYNPGNFWNGPEFVAPSRKLILGQNVWFLSAISANSRASGKVGNCNLSWTTT